MDTVHLQDCDDLLESRRLAELRSLGILNSGTDQRFERVVDMIRDVLEVPTSFVSLIDSSRQWFKAKRGSDLSETPRSMAFCDHTIRSDAPLVVPDTYLDERFRLNPLVTGATGFRSYVGSPIIMPSGHRLGTVCALDIRPRTFTDGQIRFLSSLAAIVADELTLIHTAEELSDQEVKLTAIINGSQDAIIVMDEDYTVTGFTPAAERIFGWTKDEMLGGSLAPLLPPEAFDSDTGTALTMSGEATYGSEAKAKAAWALAGGDWRQTRAMHRDGRRFPILATIGKADPGKVTRYVMVARDMSEALSFEEKLLFKSEEAEKASRSKSMFLAHMSHELRTPLNAIIGMSDVLKDNLFGPLGDRRYDSYASSINEAGYHLLSIIEGILDLSTLEARPAKPMAEQFDLRDRVSEALRMVEPQARSRSISILDFSQQRAQVSGDSRYCRQILINLLSNAVKFSPEGSTIRIETRPGDDGRHWMADVIDQGDGMPPEVMDRLGEPFLQAANRENLASEGVGLGLAISLRLARSMNADLTFTNGGGEINGKTTGVRARLSMEAVGD